MSKVLNFKNGKFKILIFSDLNESVDLSKRINALRTKDTALFLEASLKALQPDLVVFNGDSAFGESEDDLRAAIDSITDSIKKLNVPLAVVFGDKENDNVDVELAKRIYSEYDNCLFNYCKDNISRSGDYYAVIHSKIGKPEFNLWFINSNGSTLQKDVSSTYDWVHDDQIKYYEKNSQMLKELGVKNSILFQHVPVVDEYRLMREAVAPELPKAVKGGGFFKNKYFVPNEPLYGNYRDPIGCSDFNNGQFDSWKMNGDVKAAFFSNSHLNDFEGYLDKILLVQCCASGFKGCFDGDRVGAKLVTINEKDLSLKTKNYYFSDFGLKAQSVLPIDSKFSNKQKRNIALAGAVGAAVGATTVILSRIFKKKN